MKVPVLMYHALVADTDLHAHRVHVRLKDFASQMNWLHENGYQTVGLEALLEGSQTRSPERPVLITFDDGFFSLYSKAMPILKELGFQAVLFLTTDPVGENGYERAPGLARSIPPNDRPLTWIELQEMQVNGWQIEAHSRTHPNHAVLNLEQLTDEVNGSRLAIENILGKSKQSYAFPYGYYSARTQEVLKGLGFSTCFSVHPGLASPGKDRFALPRLSIERQTTLEQFARQVSTGYVSAAQQVKSKVRDALFYFPFVKDLIASQKRKIPG